MKIMQFSVSRDDQRLLLRYARDLLRSRLSFKALPPAPKLATNLRCGAFVTLKERGELRGCIGRMRGDETIEATVAEMAWAAASEDPRFSPVRAEELCSLEIEITLLSPLEPIAPEAVEIGKHGLLISAHGRSGVLLPQVPVEYGWNREEFLEHLCAKAGLPSMTWASPSATLYGFEGSVFSESSVMNI